jgi:hypothetical protein
LQAPKTHQVNKKITSKKEKEGKRTEGALGACGKKKTQTNKQKRAFLGKSLGKPGKDIHALDSPEN